VSAAERRDFHPDKKDGYPSGWVIRVLVLIPEGTVLELERTKPEYA
jgi:hypothetical protein